MLSVAGNI